jgi:ferritin
MRKRINELSKTAKKHNEKIRQLRVMAQFMQEQIYSLTLFERIVYALGVIFKWGSKSHSS